MSQEPIILAIETALQNGSLSLLKGNTEIDSIKGESKVSRAEDLLNLISTLLQNNGLSVRDVNLLAVSEGPGSFTGIRIGISTAQALAFGIKCEFYGVSILEAVAFEINEPKIVVVFPFARNLVVWQEFITTPEVDSKPQTATLGEFVSWVQRREFSRIVIESGLLREIKRNNLLLEKSSKVIYASDNVSKIIGLYSFSLFKKNIPQRTTSPMYLLESEIGRR